MVIEVHSYTKNTLWFITVAQLLLLLRNILPLGDIDSKSIEIEDGALEIFILI